MDQIKVTILKKDGDFYYRIRKDKKLVTVARIIRKTKFTSKIEEHKKQILQDFELNFDLMVQQVKDRLKKIKNTKPHQINVEQDSI